MSKPTYSTLTGWTTPRILASLAGGETAVQLFDIPFVAAGIATSGASATLSDDTQTWTDQQWAGSALVIERDGVQTRHVVQGNIADTLGFQPALGSAVEATATIGSGVDPQGQITVTLVGKGADGNQWLLLLIAGETDTGEDTATVDVEGQAITVIIDSSGAGEPRTLMAGNLAGIFASDVPEHISAPEADFTAGVIPLGTVAEPLVITFSGGADAPAVQAGERYWILNVVQPQAGAVKLGGASDYLAIAADGTPMLVGGAVVWDDLDFAQTIRTVGGAKPPVWTQISNTGVYAWGFQDDDEAWFQRQIPHKFKTNSNWRAHVHWMATTTATYTGTWTLTLTGHVTSATPANAPLITTITRTGSFDVAATAWQGHLTQLNNDTPGTEIDGSTWGISTILFAHLELTLSLGTTCILSGFDLHGQIDAWGSAEEYVKAFTYSSADPQASI